MKSIYTLLVMKILPLFFVVIMYECSAQKISNCVASPYPIDIKQADGSVLTIVGKGNMRHSWTETTDGYTIIKKNGIYEYATEVNGKLVATGLTARNIKARKQSDIEFLKEQPKSLKPDPATVENDLKHFPPTNDISALQQASFPSTGGLRVLLLLIKYPDLPNTYSVSNFNNLMNQANYRGTGSFKDFFFTSSFGQLTVNTDVFGWYTAANPYKYYGYSNGFERSTHLVREAVNAAQAAGIDFSQYDNDRDGKVDGIIVAHAGPGAEEGSQDQYIWSHRWALSAGGKQVVYDGVLIDDYSVNPEVRLFSNDMVGRGIFCHEFGHNLGLPDLYDTNGGSEGLGEWSLMASAGWLGGEHTPGNMCAWSKDELNWLTPTVLAANGSYSLNAASTSNQVFRINTPVANEYFLLENRQKTGLDVSLKGSGLAIYHINTNSGGNWDENLKRVDLEEADAKNDLDNQINRGDAGDLFPGSSKKTSFTNESYPNSKTYAGNPTNISVNNISIDATGKAVFNLSLISATAPIVNSFTPISGPTGVGVMIKGTNFVNGSTKVKFNGITASQVYVASSTLLYVTVPAGATTGKIEVVTNGVGQFSNTSFSVSSISSSWTSRSGLKTPRAQHGAIAVNGKIYVFGGYNSTGVLNTLEIYDPNTNTWSAGANMPSARRGMFFTAGSNGLIYVIGGRSASNTSTTTTYSYNPATNTWKTLASLPGALWEGAAAATPNGKIYLFGGDLPTSTSGSNTNYIYNIATNSWSTGAKIPTAVKQHSAITGKDGRIYIIGGRPTSESAPSGKVQIYNPGTNTWSTGASMPIAKVKSGAVLAEDGKIYIIGGKAQYNNNVGPFFHTVEIYTPSTNSWTSGPSIPIQDAELEAVNNNGNLYAIGGVNGTYRNYSFRLILAPIAPSGLTAAAYLSQINLKWKDHAKNESNYVIERAMASGGPFTVIATIGSSATAYTNAGLTVGATYYYRVKAINSAGSSAYSNTASTTIFGLTGSPAPFAQQAEGQQSERYKLQARPNPAVSSTQISFSVDESQQVQLDVFDIKGKLVRQLFNGYATAAQTYQFEWNTGSHASGMYISRLITQKGVLTERIVVISGK